MCFSLAAVEQLLIWLVIVCAVVALLKLVLVPFVIAPMGGPGTIIVQVINIVVWAIIAIFCIYVIFDLIMCLAGGFPRLR